MNNMKELSAIECNRAYYVTVYIRNLDKPSDKM